MAKTRDFVTYLQSEEYKKDKENARSTNYFTFWATLQGDASTHKQAYILKHGEKGEEEYNKIKIYPFRRKQLNFNPSEFVENELTLENARRDYDVKHPLSRQITPDKKPQVEMTSRTGMYGQQGKAGQFSELKEPAKQTQSSNCCSDFLKRIFSR